MEDVSFRVCNFVFNFVDPDPLVEKREQQEGGIDYEIEG